MHQRIFGYDQPDFEAHIAAIGELDRVADEIQQHLSQMRGVAAQNVRDILRDVDLIRQLFAACGRRDDQTDVLDDFGKPEIDQRKLELARLDRGNVEHILDQRQQRARRCLDGVEIFALFGIQPGRREQFRHARKTVERRPELMAHVRKEAALGFIGPIGFLGRAGQCAQQAGEIHRNGGEPDQQADRETGIPSPVRGVINHRTERDHRHRDRRAQIAIAEAQAVAHRDPHQDHIDPGQGLAQLDHRRAHQRIVGDHADETTAMRHMRADDDGGDDGQADDETRRHQQQNDIDRGVAHVHADGAAREHVDQHHRKYRESDDRLLVLGVRPIFQPGADPLDGGG